MGVCTDCGLNVIDPRNTTYTKGEEILLLYLLHYTQATFLLRPGLFAGPRTNNKRRWVSISTAETSETFDSLYLPFSLFVSFFYVLDLCTLYGFFLFDCSSLFPRPFFCIHVLVHTVCFIIMDTYYIAKEIVLYKTYQVRVLSRIYRLDGS